VSGVFLTLNAGSSSLKFAVFACTDIEQPALIRGKVAGIGNTPVFSARSARGTTLDKGSLGTLDTTSDHGTVISLLLPWLEENLGDEPLLAVGHRVVHGGQFYDHPILITPKALQDLETLVPLAPLHQPHNIAAIRAVAQWRPDTPQIACFDTGFHRTQDRLAQLFALPRDLSEQGVLRYGFHGLSYEYIASALPQHLPNPEGRVVVAHLGNGSSMCAMKNRKSVATSMGFTALDGLMMGRRCGALDPGVVLYLMQAKGMSVEEVETLLYKKSGLLGVSELSNDMQVLQDSGDPRAKEAIDLFCYKAASNLSALVQSIGGLDALVFTAGIGENAPLIRQKICERMAWLGVALDENANNRAETNINKADSKVTVLCLPTNEEVVVARACSALLA